MTNKRLFWTLENKQLLNSLQSGGRNKRCTIDNLVFLENEVTKGFANKEHTIAIFLDIVKAFEMTWRYKIIKTLQSYGIGGLQKTVTSQLSYDSVPLVFVDKIRFLGLIWDRKLTWEPHIISTRSRVLTALNALKMVSNKKWGVRRETLLLFYKSYVLPIFDYGSIVYASAKDKFLNKLNTVHHLGIRIATGAYRSSPVESLYVESGIPPLSLRREKLIVNYVSKVSASPFNPVRNILFSPLNTTGFSVHKPKPLAFRYRDILPFRYQLASCEILPFSRDIPPWFGKDDLPFVDTELCSFKKAETSPLVYKQKFLHIISTKYSSETLCYTDGSKSADSTSCAFSIDGSIQSFALNTVNSVFSAELIGIVLCLKAIKNIPSLRFLIVSDSLSALMALSNPGFSCPIISQLFSVWSELKSRGKFVSLLWCPSHCGISGNEAVDLAAKNPVSLVPLKLCSPFDFKILGKKILLSKWQARWDQVRPDNKLKRLKTKIENWSTSAHDSRFLEVILTRSRIGHSRLTHSYLFTKTDPPICQCGAVLSISHLLTCPSLIQARSRLPCPPSLGDCADGVNSLFLYLRTTNMIQKI
ncbi:hypothetical protein WDU94_005494 [Cyamophila willieti]